MLIYSSIPGWYMFRGYHSLPNAGTEYAPQWMKIPNFASSYHGGTSYFCRDSHSGRYGPSWSTLSTSSKRAAHSPSYLLLAFCQI
jgi:hypothetical protein